MLRTAKEFHDLYYQGGNWSKSDEIAYNVILKAEEKIKKDKELINQKTSRKKKEKEDDYNDLSTSELNKLSLDITKFYVDKFPITWKTEIKTDKKLKEVIKEIKKRKK